MRKFDIVDLEQDENKIIALEHHGQLRLLTKPQLLELLDQFQGATPRATNKASGASLASVGNLASRLLDKALEGDFSLKGQENLAQALRMFNGIIKQRATSPAYYRLQKLKQYQEITPDLRLEIDKFIKKYPQLATNTPKIDQAIGKKRGKLK